MATFISHSPAETEALGEAWGRAAERGLVIGLSGDLGAGKTQLVKGLARGLGIAERVHSPTFALVNIYTGGRLTLFHLDLYRLETRGADRRRRAGRILAARRRDGDRVGGTLVRRSRSQRQSGQPQGLRWVQIEVLSETERRITYEDSGA